MAGAHGMTDNVIVTHTKHDNIADWTQVTVDAQIAAGNLPPGTLLADLVLPSDWNSNHTIAGMTQLLSSLRDYVLVDMGGGDYTMTDAEAVAFLKIVVNTGVGKTLTWPTTADSYAAIDQQVSTQYSANDIILSSQTGGTNCTLLAATSGAFSVSVIPGVAISYNHPDSVYYRSGTNGVNVRAASYTATADDAGKLIVFTAGTSLTIDISATPDYATNAVIRVLNRRAGAAVIAAIGAGITFSGQQTVSSNCIMELQRDGDTDDWYCSTVNNEFITSIDDSGLGAAVYPVWVNSTNTTTFAATSGAHKQLLLYLLFSQKAITPCPLP